MPGPVTLFTGPVAPYGDHGSPAAWATGSEGEPMGTTTMHPSGVEGAHRRREALRAAMLVLEDAITHPITDHDAWCQRVGEALAVAATTITDHINETEAPGGMYDQLVEGHERLHNRVEALRAEHPELTDTVNALHGECLLVEDPEAIRDGALALLGKLARHRSRGADLLYEAYSVDVSVGD